MIFQNEIKRNVRVSQKLQRFLTRIDQQVINEIQKYLRSQIHKKRSQSQRKLFQLHHDLLIIHTFKRFENNLNQAKQIQQICLKIIIQFDVPFEIVSIRDRVQKKLSNLTKYDIMYHIHNNLRFIFDASKKLVKFYIYVQSTEEQVKIQCNNDVCQNCEEDNTLIGIHQLKKQNDLILTQNCEQNITVQNSLFQLEQKWEASFVQKEFQKKVNKFQEITKNCKSFKKSQRKNVLRNRRNLKSSQKINKKQKYLMLNCHSKNFQI